MIKDVLAVGEGLEVCADLAIHGNDCHMVLSHCDIFNCVSRSGLGRGKSILFRIGLFES